MATTSAEHPQRCAVCDEDIEPGDRITLLEDDGEWVHERCAAGGDG